MDRVSGLLEDYLEYHKRMVQHFIVAPSFAFHWNVVAGWEWKDESCLDELAKQNPDPAKFEHAYRYLDGACHRDSSILLRLLDELCEANACPATVYLDVDLTYLTGYALDVMRRDKAIIRAHGVGFGIDLVDECNAKPGCVETSTASDQVSLQMNDVAQPTENMRDQESILNKFDFLLGNGIVDTATRFRIQSWNLRPYETETEVDEKATGSFANTALRLFAERLIPNGFASNAKNR